MKKFSMTLLAIFVVSLGFAQISTKEPATTQATVNRQIQQDYDDAKLDAYRNASARSKAKQTSASSKLESPKNQMVPPVFPQSVVSTPSSKSPNVVIWSNDFSQSSQWSIQNLAGNTQNWVISTTGPVGFYSESLGLPNSPTVANGFAMYDSDAIGVSTNTVGSQHAVIQYVSPISLVGYNYVRLKFHQIYRKYNSQTFVDFRIGATGVWQELEVNASLNENDFGAEIVEVDISSLVGNSANVYIRFRYYGEWDYAWMVDDVLIEESFTNDALAGYVFTLGEIPAGVSHSPQGIVANAGASTITSLTGTLSISGSNTGSLTASASNLLSGSAYLLNFPSFSSTNTGSNTFTLTIPADNNLTNNSVSYHQVVGSAFSYADTSEATGGLGYDTGEGIMMSAFESGASQVITATKVFIATGATNVGKTIYGVCLNASGTIVASSPNYVIQTADLGTWKTLTYTTPVTFNNATFYSGIAQVADAVEGFFPMGTQSEPYIREGAYYITGLSGGTPTEANTYGRFMLGAVVGQVANYDIGIVEMQTSGTSCQLTASESITISIENFGTNSVSNFPVSYSVNGGPAVVQTVTASIPSGSVYDFTFNTTANMFAEGHYTVSAETQLTNDGNTGNDFAETIFVSGTSTINLELLTDDYGEESYWGLFDSAGELVYVGGLYDSNTLYQIELCAASNQCYTFVMFDDYGDGIEAPGYYEVYYNNVLVGANYAFTGSEDYVFNIGGGCLQNDLGVDMVYTHGKHAKDHLAPHTIQALVFNYGSATQSNVAVNLSVSGANTFTGSYTISSLASGQEVIVEFPNFSPQNLGQNTVTVSVGNDENNLNNSYSYYQEVGMDLIGYADTSGIITSLGFGTSDGIIMNRYELKSPGSIQGVSMMVGTDTTSVGQVIYGVLLDQNLTILASSANYTLQLADLSEYVELDFATPVSLPAGTFYVGFAQTAAATPADYYPLAVQDEPYTRPNTFYSASLTGADTASYTNFGRFVIDAKLDYSTPAFDIQVVEIHAGWGIYSAYVVPLEAHLDTLFDGITSQIRIVKTGTGQIYWPAFSVNTIGSWNNMEAYFINAIQPVELIFEGTALVPENSPINLTAGWNMMPYLRDEPGATVPLMDPIVNNIVLMKDAYGGIYWVQFLVSTIDSLRPDLGYQILMNDAVTYTYPSNSISMKSLSIGSANTMLQPEYYSCNLNTANNMTIGIPAELLVRIPVGSEIGVFTTSGNLVGSTRIDRQNAAISVWGTNELIPYPQAAQAGEALNFRVFDGDAERMLQIDSWSQGSGNFQKDGIAVAESLRLEGNEQDFSVYPNPASSILQVNLEGNAANWQKLTVYNLLGSRVLEYDSSAFSGQSLLSIPVGGLPSGFYLLELKGNNTQLTKRFEIKK